MKSSLNIPLHLNVVFAVAVWHSVGLWLCFVCATLYEHVNSAHFHVVTPSPIGEQSIVMSNLSMSVCVCVCVCRSAVMSSELHVRFSPFLCMLPMTVARFPSDCVVIRYVLPVLWMTSYLLTSQGCSTSPPSWSAVHVQEYRLQTNGRSGLLFGRSK